MIIDFMVEDYGAYIGLTKSVIDCSGATDFNELQKLIFERLFESGGVDGEHAETTLVQRPCGSR